ncbi:RluA family pseudouridine synthase [Candidatus Dependentiae bacterium]|nr:RluA family pseudouridine synthase [Candidatus Dependentiae bacterium]
MVNEQQTTTIHEYLDAAPQRLDLYVASLYQGYSRSFIARLIKQGAIKINGIVIEKPGYTVTAGDCIEFTLPAVVPLVGKPVSHDHGVTVLYEHEDFIIVQKPAGLLVHPPHGYCQEVTLVDCLISLFPALQTVGKLDRPGIVHRLDKDTSGIMVIPLNNYSLTIFGDKFKNRQMNKQYMALVHGEPPQSMMVDKPIGRDPLCRVRMAAGSHTIEPRTALTHCTTIAYQEGWATVLCHPVTGRTHQIRVHLASMGYPLLGDDLYGGNKERIARQALHAHKLSFDYGGQQFAFVAPLPEDMMTLVGHC